MQRERSAAATQRSRSASMGWYALYTVLSIVIVFPLYMTIVRALSNPTTTLLRGEARLTPLDIQWDAFSTAFTENDLGRPLLLSLLVTLTIVAGQLVTSVLAAYAFAFLEFPLKRTLFGLVVATLLLPIEVTILTNLQTFQDLGWVQPSQTTAQSFGALTLPFLATAVGIFLIRQGFLGIPRDLRDAAALDGFGHRGFLWRIAVPVTRPIIASFILIASLGAWSQYVWPRRAIRTEINETIQLTLRAVGGGDLDRLNLPFAAAIIASIPVLVLLVVFQRQLVRGLTAGAVKG